ncbi:MAG: hypothetical protein H8F28_25375 [Fibrella sp.]|nr:hypothetical protein [Armatimonadota bacterium]
MHFRFRFVFLLLLFLLIAAPLNADPAKRLTLDQAVRAAEEFIKRNGYTDLPPTQDKIKLSYESIEWAENSEKMLEGRRDTLERRAYGYRKYSRRGAGWTVVFRYKEPSVSGDKNRREIYIRSDGKGGRAVTMDSFGRNMRVEHVDFRLKACTRLKSGEK